MTVAYLDVGRGLDVAALAALGAMGLVGLIAGCLVKVRDDSTGRDERSGLGGVEAFLLVIAGALLARTFVWLLLLPLSDVEAGSLVLGHLFFLVFAVVDDVIAIGGSRVFATPEGLLFLATVIGGLCAMFDGIWRIHDWKGLGWLAFPLDMTWGLAGSTYGALLHLVNFAWGEHATETRRNGHRYASGFRLKPTFAFTQGSVMSNLTDAPGTSLYRHEMTHVWQHRAFGPFYTLTYIAWMIVWLIPGLIAGAACKDSHGHPVGAGQGVQRWCYFNCPWEVWGYAVQGQSRTAWGPELIWSAAPVIVCAVVLFGGLTALALVLYGLQL